VKSKTPLVDVISEASELGHTGASELTQVGSFKAFRVREPSLSLGGRDRIYYPLEFRDIRRFYTSDQNIEAVIKPYVVGDRGKSFFDNFIGRIRGYSRHHNFHINVEPAIYKGSVGDALNDMLSFMRNASQHSRQANYVAVLVAGKLGEEGFYRVKAYGAYYSMPTHIINMDKVNEILQSCRRERERKKCPELEAYLLNNYVQLYAKAGGIPWVASDEDSRLLSHTAIVGLAASRLGDTGYLAGVMYAVAYMGREVLSYVYSEIFEEKDLDIEILRTDGLYIPASVAKNALHNIRDRLSSWNINRYVIFQTTIIHPDEVKGLSEALKDTAWLLVHVKETGFTKRVYNLDTKDYGPYRGLCLVDEDSIESSTPIRALLTSTGIIKVRRRDWEEERRLYISNTTPRPLELELLYEPRAGATNSKHLAKGLALYICRLSLLLSKLDCEAYTSWPKTPFVVKYARRIARVLSTLYQQGRAEDISFARILIATLQREPKSIRYIM